METHEARQGGEEIDRRKVVIKRGGIVEVAAWIQNAASFGSGGAWKVGLAGCQCLVERLLSDFVEHLDEAVAAWMQDAASFGSDGAWKVGLAGRQCLVERLLSDFVEHLDEAVAAWMQDAASFWSGGA